MNKTELLDRAAALMTDGTFASDADRAEFDRLLDEAGTLTDPVAELPRPDDVRIREEGVAPARFLTRAEQIEQRIALLEQRGSYPSTGIVVSGSSYGPAGLRRTLEHLAFGILSDIERQLDAAEHDAARRDRLDALVRA